MESRNTNGIWQNTEAAGFILWETLVSLPLVVMLLGGCMTIFLWCMHMYFINLADAELVQEVQGAFVRIVEDGLRGEHMVPVGQEEQVFEILSKADPLAKHTKKDDLRKDGKFHISYGLHTMEGTKKLIRGGRIEAPLTGDHALARVTIVEISADSDVNYPGIYKLRIKGRSEVTQHEYTLCSAVYLP